MFNLIKTAETGKNKRMSMLHPLIFSKLKNKRFIFGMTGSFLGKHREV